MIQLIIKRYIKNYQDIHNHDVRESYGTLSGILGILCNVFLFLLKLSIGLMMNSIAILSDAFNNLSDTGSSIVTIVGAKISNKDADPEHPYGHGRSEYIASLIISFIIMLVGIELLREALAKIRHPEPLAFSLPLIIILGVSILVKLWMYSYNTYIAKAIGSTVNKATAMDSLNDCIATGAVVVATILGQYTAFPIDGVAGTIVSLLIIYTGFSLAKETVHLLLGTGPSPETIQNIENLIQRHGTVSGVHDLKVHDYGPGRVIASVHVELSDQTDLVDAHERVDCIEKEIKKELGIDIVIHVDPIGEGHVGHID